MRNVLVELPFPGPFFGTLGFGFGAVVGGWGTGPQLDGVV